MKLPATPQTFAYGSSSVQKADLFLPEDPDPVVVCLLHGGFWRVPHGRDQFAAVAADLVARGVRHARRLARENSAAHRSRDATLLVGIL